MAVSTILQPKERSEDHNPGNGPTSRATTQMEKTHSYSLAHRLGFVAFALAILVPLWQGVSSSADTSPALGADGGVIHRKQSKPILELEHQALVRRDDSPIDVCTRWAHQCESVTRMVLTSADTREKRPSSMVHSTSMAARRPHLPVRHRIHGVSQASLLKYGGSHSHQTMTSCRWTLPIRGRLHHLP